MFATFPSCDNGLVNLFVRQIQLVGGVVTFKNSKKLKEIVEEIPLESIVLETDCPYLAPTPFRGKRNSSLYLPYVVEAIAELKGISAEQVIEQTEKNARDLYQL